MEKQHAWSKNITEMNDDSLRLIFEKLNMPEQYTATLVCTRFRDLIVDMWVPKYRKFRTSQSLVWSGLKPEHQQEVFKLIASRVESLLIGDTWFDSFKSYLGRYEGPELYFYLGHSLESLEALCVEDTRFHDEHVGMILRKCPNLEKLCIMSPLMIGTSLGDITTLKELFLPNCVQLFPRSLSKIMTNLNLELLDVTNCKLEAVKQLSELSYNQTKMLKELRISEDALTGFFSKNFARLFRGLEVLVVSTDRVVGRKDGLWLSFLDLNGVRIRRIKMDIYSKDNMENVAKRFFSQMDLMCNVQKMEIYVHELYHPTSTEMMHSEYATRFFSWLLERCIAFPNLTDLVLQLSASQCVNDCFQKFTGDFIHLRPKRFNHKVFTIHVRERVDFPKKYATGAEFLKYVNIVPAPLRMYWKNETQDMLEIGFTDEEPSLGRAWDHRK